MLPVLDKTLYITVSVFLLFIQLVLVDGGQRAVIFDRFAGVKDEIIGEGTHFLIPWVQKPIIFDIRSTPRIVAAITGSKGAFFISPLVFTVFFRSAECPHHSSYSSPTRA